MESLSTVYSGTFGGRAGGAIPTVPYNQLGVIRQGGMNTPNAPQGTGGFGAGGSMSMLLSGASLASTGLSYYAQQKSGKLQEAALKLQQMQQRQQARQIEINAAADVNTIKSQLIDNIASAGAFFAARGVDTSSGSAAAILAKSRRNAQEDIMNIKDQSQLEAVGLRKQAKQTGKEASAARKSSKLRSYETLTGAIKPASQLYGSMRSLLND